MRKNLVGLIWLAGIVLALIVYQVGPDRILYSAVNVVDNLRGAINDLFAALAVNTYDVMRALTLGLLPAFIVLGFLAHRRGRRSIGAMIVVAVLFLLLLYQPAREGWYVSSTRWTIAFFAVAIGCAVMTRRLTEPDRVWQNPRGVPPSNLPPGAPPGPPPSSPWTRPSS